MSPFSQWPTNFSGFACSNRVRLIGKPAPSHSSREWRGGALSPLHPVRERAAVAVSDFAAEWPSGPLGRIGGVQEARACIPRRMAPCRYSQVLAIVRRCVMQQGPVLLVKAPGG